MLLAYEGHLQNEFTDDLIKSLNTIEQIAAVFCIEEGVGRTIEQIITEYKLLTPPIVSKNVAYDSFKSKLRLLESILSNNKLRFCAMNMPDETKKLYGYGTPESIEARDRYMAKEIENKCIYGIVFAMVGFRHFDMARLLREKNIKVVEIASQTPPHNEMKYIQQLHPGLFSYYKATPNDYDAELIKAAFQYLSLACMFREDKIRECGDYNFKGLKLHYYTDPKVNNAERLENYLLKHFPPLLAADSAPKIVLNSAAAAQPMDHKKRGTVILAYEHHYEYRFIDTITELFPLLKNFISVVCYEREVGTTIEPLIEEHKAAAQEMLEAGAPIEGQALERYKSLEASIQLLSAIRDSKLPFHAIDMNEELHDKLYISGEEKASKGIDARNRHMVEKIAEIAYQHRNIFARVGTLHFKMAALLREIGFEVIEYFGTSLSTLPYHKIETLKNLTEESPNFFTQTQHIKLPILALLHHLDVACIVLAVQEGRVFPECGKYEFKGIILNYSNPTVDPTQQMKTDLLSRFPELALNTDLPILPEVAAVQLEPSVGQATQQTDGSSFEHSPAESQTAELGTAGNLSENVPEIAAVPIGGEL